MNKVAERMKTLGLRYIKGEKGYIHKFCKHCGEKMIAKDYETLSMLEHNCMHTNPWYVDLLKMADDIERAEKEAKAKEKELKKRFL